jgi:hypothetical protein
MRTIASSRNGYTKRICTPTQPVQLAGNSRAGVAPRGASQSTPGGYAGPATAECLINFFRHKHV